MGRLENVIGTNIIVTLSGDEIRLGHTWHEVDVIKSIIKSFTPPIWFIEIGVHEGGLSYLLLQEFRWLDYVGIELDCMLVRVDVVRQYDLHPLANLHCLDCFHPAILEWMATHDPKIIYCDGGNKAKELAWFKETCVPGDLIFTHDYYDGNRKVRDVPDDNISKEVLPMDIVHMDTDPTFVRYDEDILKETRIIGWRKL
jgi:hypothetical protein